MSDARDSKFATWVDHSRSSSCLLDVARVVWPILRIFGSPAYLRNGGSEAFQIWYADYWSCLPHSGRVHGHNVLESVQNKDIVTITTTHLTVLYWWWPGWAGTRKALTPSIQCLLNLYNLSNLVILPACFFMSTRSLWLSTCVSISCIFHLLPLLVYAKTSHFFSLFLTMSLYSLRVFSSFSFHTCSFGSNFS